jgi:gamma-glutamyltranspeptidase/glutathione hydrolase
MADRDGLITARDLAEYAPQIRPALQMSLAGWELATNPPPSIGGPVLAVMLSELARRPQRTWRDVLEVQRHVLEYRFHVHDHSSDLEEDGYALLETVERHGLKGLPTSSSTVNISAVDAAGNACAITASSGYGSGATVPGTGLMMNNCLGEPELNKQGLHALIPGTRLASNMAPTVGRGPQGQVMAIGSPGADRITTALAQVLVRYCLMGIDLQEAIDRPRLHLSIRPDGSSRVEYEDDEDLERAAVWSGLPVVEHQERSMFFGGVGAALRGADGSMRAAGDLRRESATGVSP